MSVKISVPPHKAHRKRCLQVAPLAMSLGLAAGAGQIGRAFVTSAKDMKELAERVSRRIPKIS